MWPAHCFHRSPWFLPPSSEIMWNYRPSRTPPWPWGEGGISQPRNHEHLDRHFCVWQRLSCAQSPASTHWPPAACLQHSTRCQAFPQRPASRQHRKWPWPWHNIKEAHAPGRRDWHAQATGTLWSGKEGRTEREKFAIEHRWVTRRTPTEARKDCLNPGKRPCYSDTKPQGERKRRAFRQEKVQRKIWATDLTR